MIESMPQTLPASVAHKPCAVALLMRQPQDIQALCLGHLDTASLDALALGPSWPRASSFGRALSQACRQHYLARCAPEQRAIEALETPQGPGMRPTHWPRALARQQGMLRQVEQRWRQKALNGPNCSPLPLPPHYILGRAVCELRAVMPPANSYRGPRRTDIAQPREPQNDGVDGAALRRKAWRALQLLGLSGPDTMSSAQGRLVACASAALLGQENYALSLFSGVWQQYESCRIKGPAVHDLLVTAKRVALLTGSALMYAQLVAWNADARMPCYGETYETAQEILQAISRGHERLVQAIMQTRAPAYSELELTGLVTQARQAQSLPAGQSSLPEAPLAAAAAALRWVEAAAQAAADRTPPNS